VLGDVVLEAFHDGALLLFDELHADVPGFFAVERDEEGEAVVVRQEVMAEVEPGFAGGVRIAVEVDERLGDAIVAAGLQVAVGTVGWGRPKVEGAGTDHAMFDACRKRTTACNRVMAS